MALSNHSTNSPNLPITILWENNCKETLYEETRTAADVFELILTDERAAVKNRFIMPNGAVIDSEDFYAWYITSFEEVPRV